MEVIKMKRLDVCAGYGVALLLSVVGILALSCHPAQGANRSACVRCVAPIRYAAPVAIAAPYYYRVGAQLQQQAADTYGFRNSEEWSEFLQLRGYKAGVESMLAASYQQSAAPAERAGAWDEGTGLPVRAGQVLGSDGKPLTPREYAAEYKKAEAEGYDPYSGPRTVRGTFEGRIGEEELPPAGTPPQPLPPGLNPPGPENTTPAPLPIPPQTPTPPAGGEAVAYPILYANCAKCHSGTDPKGQIWLDGTVDLRGEDAAETRDKIVRVLWLGHMPPDQPATDEIVGGILDEIYVE
jgi:hypothetical protein